MFAGVVADEAFQLADGDGFALDAEHALTFALLLLRTDTPANGGKRRITVDDAGGLFKVALRHLTDKVGNVDIDRTALYAAGHLAMQAALRLRNSLLRIVAEANLPKVGGTHLRILLTDRHPLFLVGHLFGNAANVANVTFRNFLLFQNLPFLHVVIHRLPFHGEGEINLCAVEFWAIHAGKLGLAADTHAAGAAHAGAIHHQGVERNGAGDVEFLGHLGDETHHDHRADGDDLVVAVAGVDELAQLVGHEAFGAVGGVVGGDVQVGDGAQFVLEDEERFRTHAHDDVGGDAVLVEPLHLRIDGGDADTAAHEDKPFGAALLVRQVDELGGTAEGSGDVVQELSLLHGGKVAGRFADSFEHDGDGAFFGITVADGQRNAFGCIRLFDNQKLPRQCGFRDSGGIN